MAYDTISSGGGSGGLTSDTDDGDGGDVIDAGTVNLADALEDAEDDDSGGSDDSDTASTTDSGGYTPPSNYSSSDGYVGDENDYDGTDSSTDDEEDDPWTDSGSGGGYTSITNDGTESTVNDTDPVQGDDASDYEDAASDGIWGEGDGSAPDNSDGSNSADVGEQIDAALAEQRAAYEAQMASLMESMPVPDQLGGADSGGGLSPVLGGTALLLAGAGALYVSQGDS